MAVRTPHFAFPFRVEDGRVAVVEQDSKEEIRQCVLAALKTRIGSRQDAPAYGITNLTFKRQSPDVDALLGLVEEVEPRARLLSAVEIEDLVKRVQIEVDTRGVA